MKRKQNPYPTSFTIQQLINMKIEKKMKELEDKVKELEEKVNELESKSIITLSPLPSDIRDFNEMMIMQKSSYDDLNSP